MPSVNAPKLDGLNLITTANNALRVGVNAAFSSTTIAIGDYFVHSHTGAPADTSQLLELIQAAINGVAGASCTLAVSDTSGRITLTNTHGANTLALDWTFSAATTALRDVLGFTGAGTGGLAPSASVTAANQHYNGWYPNVPPSDVLGDPSLVGVLDSDASVSIAPSGRIVTTKFFEHTRQMMEFSQLSDSVCLPLDTTVNSYQQFWQRILSAGVRFRYYPDREDRNGPTGVGPFTYVADQKTASEGSGALERTVAFWGALYDLRVGMRLFVA